MLIFNILGLFHNFNMQSYKLFFYSHYVKERYFFS